MSPRPIHALVRSPTQSLARCALTHLARRPIDAERAAAQHRAYVAALEEAGAHPVHLPEEPDLPDAPFVEDTAVAVGAGAILARPADALRRRELPSVERALGELLSVPGGEGGPAARIEPPGTLEGGDVLAVGERLFVGITGRTDREGARQLAGLVERLGGFEVIEVPVSGCLHLKTAVTEVAPGVLLANPAWVDAGALERALRRGGGGEVVPVDPAEPFAANTLTVGSTLLASASHPRTIRRLERHGLAPRPVDVSELEKAEAGLTCLSLILRS